MTSHTLIMEAEHDRWAVRGQTDTAWWTVLVGYAVPAQMYRSLHACLLGPRPSGDLIVLVVRWYVPYRATPTPSSG